MSNGRHIDVDHGSGLKHRLKHKNVEHKVKSLHQETMKMRFQGRLLLLLLYLTKEKYASNPKQETNRVELENNRYIKQTFIEGLREKEFKFFMSS